MQGCWWTDEEKPQNTFMQTHLESWPIQNSSIWWPDKKNYVSLCHMSFNEIFTQQIAAYVVYKSVYCCFYAMKKLSAQYVCVIWIDQKWE